MSDRRIFHIVAGDDNWTPTMDELNQIKEMFMDATLDPEGALIVSRNAIELMQEQPSIKVRVHMFDPDKDLMRLACDVLGD
jgi:hypothetical protein